MKGLSECPGPRMETVMVEMEKEACVASRPIDVTGTDGGNVRKGSRGPLRTRKEQTSELGLQWA